MFHSAKTLRLIHLKRKQTNLLFRLISILNKLILLIKKQVHMMRWKSRSVKKISKLGPWKVNSEKKTTFLWLNKLIMKQNIRRILNQEIEQYHKRTGKIKKMMWSPNTTKILQGSLSPKISRQSLNHFKHWMLQKATQTTSCNQLKR